MTGKVLIICIAVFFIPCFIWANPVRKTIQVGGFKREYLVYNPDHPKQEKAGGIIVCLHGFTRTMNDFFETYNVSSVADSLNLIMVAPQALPEQDPLVNLKASLINSFTNDQLSLNSVWGCGLRVKVLIPPGITLLNEELNEFVDDADFINNVIDNTLLDYNLPSENVFILGTSMGGYMAYQFALKSGNRLSGLISIAGSMGLSIKGMDSATKLPVCDFHSITDEVVPYSGIMEQVVYLAMNKTEVIKFWTEINETGMPTTEQMQKYPSTNGISVEKITYDSDNEVIHYKMNGASHGYFFKKENGDCMDYIEEIEQFIGSHLSGGFNHIPDITAQKSFLYPNPTNNELRVTGYELQAKSYGIFNITGQMVMQGKLQRETTTVNVSALTNGVYFLKLSNEVMKFVKQ